MHEQINKKTQRQRNRPRNKANRMLLQLEKPQQPALVSEMSQQEAIAIIQQALRARILQKQQKQNKSDDSNIIKQKTENARQEQVALMAQLQKKIESVMKHKEHSLFGNLKMLMLQQQELQQSISDVASSSEGEDEYIEYVYRPRQYFLISLCHLCKCDLQKQQKLPCRRCGLVYYCSMQHMQQDLLQHRSFCSGLQNVANNCGGQIFRKCGSFSADQFRSYRIVMMRQVESLIERTLKSEEQEVLLFPRICIEPSCREYRFNKLLDCTNCNQVAYCKDKSEHLGKNHQRWCADYQVFQQLIMQQLKFGRLEPTLPTKLLQYLPEKCRNTKQMLQKLNLDTENMDACELAILSQVTTAPLTAWYALKLCGQWQKPHDTITIHLIGAEIDFELDVLNKWELFFMHITPGLKQLNVVFVGPELNTRGIDFEQIGKTKCCRNCRAHSKTVNYYFKSQLYHDYCKQENFQNPQLICFFNAGLHRETGFQLEDTWPETLKYAAKLACPLLVTSYTQYEAPLDMRRLLQESNRTLHVIMPPTMNPFASTKPERNFISDHEVPLIFKNYYVFIMQ